MFTSWLVARIMKSTRMVDVDRPQPADRGAEPEAGHGVLGDRRVEAALLAELLDQALCRAEDLGPGGNADAVDEDPGVALHLLRHRLADGAAVIKLSHGTHPHAAGPVPGSAPATPASRSPGWPCRSPPPSRRSRSRSPGACQPRALHLQGVTRDPFALDRRLVAVAPVPVRADADMLEVAAAFDVEEAGRRSRWALRGRFLGKRIDALDVAAVVVVGVGAERLDGIGGNFDT